MVNTGINSLAVIEKDAHERQSTLYKVVSRLNTYVKGAADFRAIEGTLGICHKIS